MFAAFMIAAHQSHVLLTFVLLLVLLPLRRILRAVTPLGKAGVARVVAPLALAVIALVSVNWRHSAGFRCRRSATCSCWRGSSTTAPAWTCCAATAPLRAGGSAHSSIVSGGPRTISCGATTGRWRWPAARKLISHEADAIIGAALRAEPLAELRAVMANTVRQLGRFATGDGLQPWPVTVTPWIERDFPRFEADAYAAARQNAGGFAVPPGCRRLHLVTALAGVQVAAAAAGSWHGDKPPCAGLRHRGPAGATGECGDHRRPVRAARSLPEPRSCGCRH